MHATMRMMCGALALANCGIVASAALIVPQSQDRSITAFADSDSQFGGYQSDSQSASAPDFGPWSESVTALLPLSNANAAQNSTIGDAAVFGTGSASTFAGGDLGSNTSAAASSDLFVTFRVTIPATFSISGGLASNSSSIAPTEYATFVFGGAEGPIYSQTADMFNPSVTLLASGSLLPGVYTIEAHANSYNQGGAGVGTNSGSANWDVDLKFVPEPGTVFFALVGVVGLRRR